MPPTPAPEPQWILILTGPAGSGKTTVAKWLASQLQWPYLEGDTFHPPANISKMASGVPLTDADRWDWLITIRESALAALQTSSPPKGVVVTCSALKKKYRDVLRIAGYHHPTIHIHFIYLHVSEETIRERVRARQGHYMKLDMVHGQFEALEDPDNDEHDTTTIEASESLPKVEEKVMSTVTKIFSPPSSSYC
ncbi:carbohydrate kinase [Piedraia hortae CBS 480.64]|uniref:Gluconokinase n=1 Tax=Piedraia hortae CBS 480.64 TaxID=1314780 RepID=A0A6A7C5C7_9PEZI|nr:carbohydrate kinase [Piedraia hortae CBS 480.64]